MSRVQNAQERSAPSIFEYIYGDAQWGWLPGRKMNSSPRRPPTPAPWYRKFARQ
ncbi:hypothetical protein AB4Y45_34560 [Paraburkholderia sp. EG287A]|uniref:hypothetical protein n=1 Tax=Paraburkholderia sp. EG287A TaxID=3237012 RepID=UPI0034D1BF64